MMNASAATLNVVIITDPTGQDVNGAAAGSMSFADNMFQSTFLLSPADKFAILSGGPDVNGVENDTARLNAIIQSINILKANGTASAAASVANNYEGDREMVGGPTIGAAVGGSFDVDVVTVSQNGTITVTPYSEGIAVLPPGTKGAIIHLRHTPGNPQADNASAVREATAIMIGEEIRDGYPATYIMGDVFKKVAIESGEKYGGGAVNIVSGITTGDMFTPTELNQTGFPMDQPYSKTDPVSGWSVAYPQAESYSTSPINGNPLQTVYAYDALRDVITVKPTNATVYVYGSDDSGIVQTTQEVVQDSVSKHGFNANYIASDINSAIKNSLLVGVNYVEPSDINIKPDTKEVGVYFQPLPDHRTAPPWNLPINSTLLDALGNLQVIIGFLLIVLVAIRNYTLFPPVKNRFKKKNTRYNIYEKLKQVKNFLRFKN